MSKTVIETVKELLPADQLQLFEAAVKKLVDTQVVEQVSNLLVLKEEELQNKYEKLSEAFIAEEIEKREKIIQASLVESYDKMINDLETKITLKIETYMDTAINEQISDEMLEKVAINETLKPVVEGVRKVFEANHLTLESNASDKVAKLQEQLAEATKKISDTTSRNLQLESKLEKTARILLIKEKTAGLSGPDATIVENAFTHRKFDDIMSGIDGYITLIKEGKKNPKPVTKPKMETMLTESDGIVVEKTVPDNTTSNIEDVASAYFDNNF